MKNRYSSLRLAGGHLSTLLDKKALLLMGALLLLVTALFIVSAGTGDMKISPLNVIKTLFGQGSQMETLVVTSFRLPRIIIAALAGIGLAMSGCILQGVVRNPLASPDIIGTTAGASVAVVGFLTAFSDSSNSLTVSISWLPFSAFLGATITTLVVYGISWRQGSSPFRLILVGIGVSALARALTTLLMILGPIYQASQANIWITGTVFASSWRDVFILLPWTLFLTIITITLSRTLNALELGDDLAIALGGAAQKQRLWSLLVSTALTGGAVAFAGGIGFVGLMAPHIARRLVGSDYGALLPVSGLIGAGLVMVADLMGRTLLSPLQIPAGVFTAVIGAPYFVYLLYRTRR